jgi:hypothetical protein
MALQPHETVLETCPHCKAWCLVRGLVGLVVCQPHADTPRPVLHVGADRYVRRRWDQHKQQCAHPKRA